MDSQEKITADIELFFNDYDIWVIPVTSEAAFKHHKPDSFDGPMPIYKNALKAESNPKEDYTIFCAQFNLTGHPSVVIPIGFDESGMPIGIQIVGKRWFDAELLQIAIEISKIATNFKNPPKYK